MAFSTKPNIRDYELELTTDGSGDATGSFPEFSGYIEQVDVKGVAGATTDITITDGDGFTPYTVLTLTNVAAGAHSYKPRVPVHDNVGGAISGAYGPHFVNRAQPAVTVAQGGASTTLQLRIRVSDEPIGVVA